MDRLSKQSRDAKKSSKETKKCETSEQRCNRYTRFLKTAGVATLLATAGMVEATRADPADRMQHSSNSLPERYVPSAKDMKQHQAFLDKMNNPSWHFGPKDAQATSRGETSQSSMETLSHQLDQNKNKGKNQLSSKDIANLQALIKKDPEARQRMRKILAERKLIVGNPLNCLDVSASQVLGSSIPSYVDTGLPGLVERLDYKLNVKNKCLQPADNVVYNVEQTTTCPTANPPKAVKPYTYEADPFLVPPGQNAGMLGLGSKYTLAGCKVYDNGIPVAMELPTVVKVKVQAMGEVPGEVPGTVTFVTSPEKIIPLI